MAKGGFKRNSRAIAEILHTVDGGKRAVGEQILGNLPDDVRAESRIEIYQTDREVVGVVVPAHTQARDGAATRAAGAL